MSWICLSPNKESIARKPHDCDICDGKIAKGERQITRSGIEEGEGFYRMHMHLECEEYSREWDQDDWECHCPGDVSRPDVLKEVAAKRASAERSTINSHPSTSKP